MINCKFINIPPIHSKNFPTLSSASVSLVECVYCLCFTAYLSPRSLHHLERETAAFLFQQLLSPVQCYEGISWAPLRKFIRFHLELNERNWGLRCGFVTHSSRFRKMLWACLFWRLLQFCQAKFNDTISTYVRCSTLCVFVDS